MNTYGTELAPMLLKQMRVSPSARILHLGYPGASDVADAIAPALDTGEMLLVVYSYDELEETLSTTSTTSIRTSRRMMSPPVSCRTILAATMSPISCAPGSTSFVQRGHSSWRAIGSRGLSDSWSFWAQSAAA
jgi:hypothetical protein